MPGRKTQQDRVLRAVIVQEYVPQYRVAFFDRLVEIARDAGIEVVVAAGLPGGELAKRADSASPAYVVPIVQKEFRFGARRIVVRNIFKILPGADLVILEQGRRNLDTYLLFLPRYLRSSVYALWGHGRDYVETRSGFSTWLQETITKRADWFFSYTPGGAVHVRDLPFDPDRISVVMNSVDTEAIRDGLSRVRTSEISEFRDRWDIAGRVISFIGAVDESKRLPFLLESMRLLNTWRSDVSLVVAGTGALLDEMKIRASDMPNVHFIGRADDHTKNIVLAASELLLVPGRVGLIAVDSLAAGVPIASTQWPLHAPEFEYLTPDVTSLITPDSALDYASAISDILSNKPQLELLTRNCITAGSDLGIEQMARNFLAGIESALIGRTAK